MSIPLVDRIEWILTTKKLSASQLARDASLGSSTVAQFLRRAKADPECDITLKTVLSIAKAGNVSVIWLVFGIGSPDDVRPSQAGPKVLAAMDLARADGATEDALYDWFAQLTIDPMWTGLQIAQDIENFLRRWNHYRQWHKPEGSTNVTLIDVIRRWPTRWSAKAYTLAQNDEQSSTTWHDWVETMNLWERQAQRSTSVRALDERTSA